MRSAATREAAACAACLLDLAFNDVAPHFHHLLLLPNLAGGGLERGLNLVYALRQLVGRDMREDISSFYVLSFERENFSNAAGNLEGNIHIRGFNGA